MNQDLISEIEEMVVKFNKHENILSQDVDLVFNKCIEAEDIETRTKVLYILCAFLVTDRRVRIMAFRLRSWALLTAKYKDITHKEGIHSLGDGVLVAETDEVIERLNLKKWSMTMNEQLISEANLAFEEFIENPNSESAAFLVQKCAYTDEENAVAMLKIINDAMKMGISNKKLLVDSTGFKKWAEDHRRFVR